MTDGFSGKAEDASRKLVEALDRLQSELSSCSGGNESVDGVPDSLRLAVGEVEGMLDVLRCAYEDRVHGLEREHSQYRTDAEQREQSTARLLQDCERENETLAERNQTLSRELKELQTRHRVAELSLKERERAVTSLTEQLGIHQESHQELSASREASEREAGEKLEEWKWRAREAERERGEREVELEQSRDMERSLRSTLLECRQQLQHTHQELQRTQQELHSKETALAATNEELSEVRHQLQPKEEELQALQEKIANRAQQLMELLDRRNGDYSRQVQEEVLAQSRAYEVLLKTFSKNGGTSSSADDQFSPSGLADMAACLRDYLNPHLLTSHPSLSTPHTITDSAHSSATSAYQRYLNTFTDFTQRVRVGEFIACPKSRLRQHRLQQWRHHFKEISLRPPPGLKMEECPLCEIVALVKGVAEKLSVAPTSLLIYTVDSSRFRGTAVKLWILRKALGATLQYEADSLLVDLSIGGHRLTFVSLADPQGAPSPMEQWEMAHYRVVGRLEESPMTDVTVGGGGEGGGGKTRSDSMDMVDLDPAQPTAQLLVSETESGRGKGSGRGSRRVGVARRVGFHLKELAGLLCFCCATGSHGDHGVQYQHLEEIHTSDVT